MYGCRQTRLPTSHVRGDLQCQEDRARYRAQYADDHCGSKDLKVSVDQEREHPVPQQVAFKHGVPLQPRLCIPWSYVLLCRHWYSNQESTGTLATLDGSCYRKCVAKVDVLIGGALPTKLGKPAVKSIDANHP